MMRILILGSGGRECAFAWKLAKELTKESIFIAPGNAGTSDYGTNVDLSISDFKGIADFCIKNSINTLLPGGEDSLVAGIRNYFESNATLSHIFVFGPDKTGAQLEGSKEFAKRFMMRHSIPTAGYKSFSKGEHAEAKVFLKTMNPPYVIKADGLAAGKGVVIPETLAEAEICIDEMLQDERFGKAGTTIVIEEFLKGIELSFFVMTDGNHYICLPEAKDYKRIGEGDTGPNTGGMGAVSPVPFADASFINKIITRIVKPTIDGLREEKINYRGFVFFGLIKVGDEPFVIEYNCRMGDPETEVVLPRLKTSLSQIIEACKNGTLEEVHGEFEDKVCATVMLVSQGYPGDYPKDLVLTYEKSEHSILFHAGTKKNLNETVTAGGRVMAVSSLANQLETALDLCYSSIQQVSYKGMNYRKDIGKDLM